MGVRFEPTPSTLNIYDGQNNLFLSPLELRKELEQEKARAEQEKARAERLAEKLKALGINPDEISS